MEEHPIIITINDKRISLHFDENIEILNVGYYYSMLYSN